MGIAALFSLFESLDRRLSNGLLSLLVVLLPWNPVTRSKGRSGFARWVVGWEHLAERVGHAALGALLISDLE